MNNNVIVVLAVVGVLALLEGVWYFIQSSGEKRKAELKRRLSSAVDDNASTATVGPQILRSRKLSHNPGVHNFLQSFDAAYRLENLLDQTELEWTVAQLLSGCAVFFSLTFFYFAILKGLFLIGLIAGVLCGLLPIYYVRRAREQRTETLSSQLPEALEMMSRSLRAGHDRLSASWRP